MSPGNVVESARRAVLLRGGNPTSRAHLLGQHEIQFGLYKEQSFKWVVENVLGWAGYLVASMQKESASQPARSDFKNHAANKMAFKEYMELFHEGREAIRIKSTTQPFKDQMPTGSQRSSTS